MARAENSKWREVICGVAQGSVFIPIMFLIYIKHMKERVKTHMTLFANDAELQRRMRTEEDCMRLEGDLNVICELSNKFKMEFNAYKCHIDDEKK